MSYEIAYEIAIRDEDGCYLRDNTYWPEDVERIGGIGAIVESHASMMKDRQQMEISKMYIDR